MGSLAARAIAAGGLRADDAPNVPSVPVQIGTPGVVYHGHNEIGSRQSLILMFIAAIVVGAIVLLHVVRQRGKVLERRRQSRMAEAARPADIGSGIGDADPQHSDTARRSGLHRVT